MGAVTPIRQTVSIRAVLDTSVLYPPGQRAALQQAAQTQSFIGIWSPWIIAELNRVLTWAWFRKHGTSVESERRCSLSAKQMMAILIPSFEVVNPVPPYPAAWETLTDQWDAPVWAAAVIGNARFVISENTRHFPPHQPDGRFIHDGIEYLTGERFLALLAGDATA